MAKMNTNKNIAVIVIIMLFLVAGVAGATSMRHEGQRVVVGDSVADVARLFGKPTMKVDLGEIDLGVQRCKVTLWVYEWFPWRYELKIGKGKILKIEKIRLRRKVR